MSERKQALDSYLGTVEVAGVTFEAGKVLHTFSPEAYQEAYEDMLRVIGDECHQILVEEGWDANDAAEVVQSSSIAQYLAISYAQGHDVDYWLEGAGQDDEWFFRGEMRKWILGHVE